MRSASFSFGVLLSLSATIAVTAAMVDEKNAWMDINMDPATINKEYIRSGSVSYHDEDDKTEDCTFLSQFSPEQLIQFNCTLDRRDTPWKWCSFHWGQPEPDAVSIKLLPCNNDEEAVVYDSSNDESVTSASEKDKLEAEVAHFLSSPLASHFVHMAIVAATDGHYGYDNIAMLQVHHLAMTMLKRSNKSDTNSWHNGGDFQELIAVANQHHNNDERRRVMFETEEDEAIDGGNSFYKQVIEPAETESALRGRRLACGVVPMAGANLQNICGNSCFGRCGRDCDCLSWVCGDCNAHRGCFEHDCICSCGSDLDSRCWSFMAHPSTCNFPSCAAFYCGQRNAVPCNTGISCGGGSAGGGCLSGEGTVDVDGKGLTKVQDLQLGDRVLAANGKYETIYSFGHISKDTTMEFLQIQTKSSHLELSPDHLVYIEGQSFPVPADNIKQGDVLRLSAATDKFVTDDVVTKITKVSRKGLYTPITASGTVVVNGVIVSSFVGFPSSLGLEKTYNSGLAINGVEIASYHFVSHVWETPYRVLRSLTGCWREHYVSGGYSLWSFIGLRLMKDILIPMGIIGEVMAGMIFASIMPLYFLEWTLRWFPISVFGVMLALLFCMGQRNVGGLKFKVVSRKAQKKCV